MLTIGIRELRQNPTPAINEAKAGRVVAVTQRGEVVAHITPPSVTSSTWDRLIAEGRLRLPAGDQATLTPPLPADPERPALSEVLQQMRDAER
ncbi:MAG: type II toxin-antitoxin system prevent-host-death family antitoxin [Propionibacteriaceae bacterium]|nr:type II toxin-antitoxin system prevent-host-death family antitoxin [Propionibacteriaceae bacterium]